MQHTTVATVLNVARIKYRMQSMCIGLNLLERQRDENDVIDWRLSLIPLGRHLASALVLIIDRSKNAAKQIVGV